MSGGYSASMLDAMRTSITVARCCEFSKSGKHANSWLSKAKPLEAEIPAQKDDFDYSQALYLATLGGARALSMEDTIGIHRV